MAHREIRVDEFILAFISYFELEEKARQVGLISSLTDDLDFDSVEVLSALLFAEEVASRFKPFSFIDDAGPDALPDVRTVGDLYGFACRLLDD